MEHTNHIKKPENTLQYIHKEFNHPRNITKQISVIIETRLSNHSSNDTVFRYEAENQDIIRINQDIMSTTVQTNKSEYKQQNQSQKKHYLVQSAV